MKTSSFASVIAVGLSTVGSVTAQTYSVRSEIGDNTINYGKSPPWHALNAINDQCGDISCGYTVSWGTHLVEGNFGSDEEILLDVSGSFNDPGEPGSKQDLVEIAKATIAGTDYDVDASVKHYTDRCATYNIRLGGCQPGGIRYDDQYYASDVINVRVEAPDGGFLADMNIVMRTTGSSAGTGACSAITSITSGVATGISAVQPAAGLVAGAFSLASLGCA